LIDVKSRTIASANSICPNLVHRIIDAFISNKPNKVLTDTAAIIFGLLSKPITDISQKYPLEHNHQQACNQLKQVEAALVNYRLIMEMEMLYNQEDAEKRKQAIPVLEKVVLFFSSQNQHRPTSPCNRCLLDEPGNAQNKRTLPSTHCRVEQSKYVGRPLLLC
jgi:hypothetical protein